MIKTFLMIMALLLLLKPGNAVSFCFEDAERTYGVSQQLLRGIARVESGMNPAAVNRNSNGSVDYGLMQVNSFWLKPLGTTSGALLNDACYNVMTGAWILKGCLDRHGETWNAVGCYNAASHNKRVNYSWKVYRELVKGANRGKPVGNNVMGATGRSAMSPRPVVQQKESVTRKTVPAVSSIEISVVEKD